jgi:NADH-quinone oxidoreductase subunit L
MHADPDRNIFFGYLSLFTFFMLVLVSSGNFVQFFIGWEGIGLCSYLLINFWYMRVEANKAAIKAVVVNKVGDCAFLIGTGLVYYYFKTINFITVSNIISSFLEFNFTPYNFLFFSFWTIDAFTVLTVFFLIAVMGKSAQIGLHTWLPDAMEGPTPVSALIHAATMVTAGIFLVIRINKLFELAPITLQLLVIIGSLTAFFAASVALLQSDIKKIIAYSTCSQLGYMLTACGLSKYGIAFFHLFTHGFFKALLFLCAGALLHGMDDDQDLRRMGGLGRQSRYLYILMLIGSLSLTGFPFLSGFYSKELIIYSSIFDILPIWGLFFYTLLVLAAIFTTLYSFRLLYLSFHGTSSASPTVSYHSSGMFINMALFVLAFCAIFVGFLFQDYFIIFNNSFELKTFFTDLDISFFIKFWLLFIVYLNLHLTLSYKFNQYLFGYLYWKFYFQFIEFRNLAWFLSKKWYFDKLINFFITQRLFNWAYKIFYLLDVYLFELFGPRGITYIFTRGARRIIYLQTGSLFVYLAIMIVSGFLLFFYTVLL